VRLAGATERARGAFGIPDSAQINSHPVLVITGDASVNEERREETDSSTGSAEMKENRIRCATVGPQDHGGAEILGGS